MALDMSLTKRAKQPDPEPVKAPAPLRDRVYRDQCIKLVMAAFGAAIPGKANSSGHYALELGELIQFGGPAPDTIPDGKYRVIGSDWAGRFEGGGLVEAFRCVPPHFGGDDIEIIN